LDCLVWEVPQQSAPREKELALVKIGAGEWDTEYARVVNSAMRFQDCVAHVGGEGWGKDGSSFGDVQLRVYLTPLSEEQVHQSASAQGFGIAPPYCVL
jgi:hypothetical protein